VTIRIWVLRHGEAERETRSDSERALTERGAAYAQAAGEWLAGLATSDLRVIASPYLRAQQTAKQVLRAFPEKTLTTFDWLVPDFNPRDVVDELAKLRDRELLLVSHQPLVSALIGLLVAADYRAGPPMETASLAELSTSIIAPGCASLLSLRNAPHYAQVSH
jgi:phosphohistidine phosphatase